MLGLEGYTARQTKDMSRRICQKGRSWRAMMDSQQYHDALAATTG